MVCGSSIPLFAGTIGFGTCYEFGFDPNHAPVVAGCQPADAGGVPCRTGINSTFLDAPPWTFSATPPVELSITDAFLAGDSFDVYDSGTLVASTPSVPLSFTNCGLDPSVCMLDPAISHSEFLLVSGSHSLTINVNAAQILGEGFVRLDPVPEPGTFYLLVVPLLLLASSRFRTHARTRRGTRRS